MTHLIDTLTQLLEDSELYADLLHIFPESINIGIELTDTNESATLTLGNEQTVDKGLKDVAVRITMTSDILTKIMRREADAFALAGRAHVKDSRPIDFDSIDQNRAVEVMEAIKGLGTFYLNPGRIKTRQLRLDLAGHAHGARPIPIVYWKGLRYAWYHIPTGSILNEDGEKDPWPQAFVVLKGSGKVHILDEILELEPGTVYYIPRNCTHQVHVETPVELLWIAWDAE
jgi:mannose-6-phosphate isomerase-like protein (cupin superfamily)